MKLALKFCPPQKKMETFDYQTQKRIVSLANGDIICFIAFLFFSIAVAALGLSIVVSSIAFTSTVLFAVSLILLKNSKPIVASYLVTGGILLAVVAVGFFSSVKTSDLVHYRTGCFCVAMAVLNMMISLKKTQILIFHIGTQLVLLGSAFTSYLPILMADPKSSISSLIINFIGIFTANSILYANANLTIDLINHSENEHKKVAETLDMVTNTLSKVNESVNIGKKLNTAANNANQKVVEIGQLYTELIAEANTVQEKTNMIKENSDEISQKAQTMANSLQMQNGSIVQTTTAMTEISTNASNINVIAQKRRESLNVIVDILDNQNMLVSELVKEFAQVKEISVEISKFVQTVDTISGQTNLLAMNASIEAAHAGAMGKGFGVIAQEIRKLSEETTKSAGKIAEVLKKNSEVIQKTSNSVDDFAKSSLNSTEEIKATVDSMEEIIHGISEMSIATQNISQELQVVVTEVQKNEDIISNVVERIDDQNVSLDSVTETTYTLKERVDDVKEKILTIGNAIEEIYEGAKTNEQVSTTIEQLLH